MAVQQGIFGDRSNFDDRFVPDYDRLAAVVASLKDVGLRIVLTSGSFDLVHEGHALYLEKAREHGDVLIVGVDSDEKIRNRKGPDRPVVPEQERLRMLTHFRPVDIVTLKSSDELKWSLIKAVRPDVLIATDETYNQEQIDELQANYCGTVVVLPRMAETTTTARLRLLQLELGKRIKDAFTEASGPFFEAVIEKVVGRHD